MYPCALPIELGRKRIIASVYFPLNALHAQLVFAVSSNILDILSSDKILQDPRIKRFVQFLFSFEITKQHDGIIQQQWTSVFHQNGLVLIFSQVEQSARNAPKTFSKHGIYFIRYAPSTGHYYLRGFAFIHLNRYILSSDYVTKKVIFLPCSSGDLFEYDPI